MKHKFLLVATILVVTLSMVPSGASASAKLQPPTPDVYLDCGVWVSNPYRIGSHVQADGEISCATSHPNLKVVVQLWDSAGNTYASVHNCTNTDSCSTYEVLIYYPDRTWKSAVSGYQGSYWNAYYQLEFSRHACRHHQA